MSEKKVCTHCKAVIDCNTVAIANCDCSKVEVSNEVRSFLAGSFHKCLCNSCLQSFEVLSEKSKGQEFPKRRSQMIEGEHYYMENEYFVFTELYHFMKGQCCQNSCRHCVYGFKNRYL